MTEHPGKLMQFLVGVAGNFRVGEEASFPWHSTDRGIWYALLVVEAGKICRYGFTSATASKEALCDAIGALSPRDEALLLGVWTGQHRTDLFVLECKAAYDYIRGSKKLDRFKHLGQILEAELIRRRGAKYLSYSYRGDDGHTVHTSTSRREETAELLAHFAQNGVTVQERPEPDKAQQAPAAGRPGRRRQQTLR